VQTNNSETRKNSSRTARVPYYNLAVRFLAVGFVLSTLVAAGVLYQVVRDMTAGYTGMGLDPFEAVGGDELYTPEPGSTPTLISIPVQPNPWDGNERVTILIMGVDYRDWLEGQGAPRSDTMMLVSLDPITKQASLLYPARLVGRDSRLRLQPYQHGLSFRRELQGSRWWTGLGDENRREMDRRPHRLLRRH